MARNQVAVTLLLSALTTASCGSGAQAQPAPISTIVISDIRLTGELQTPTPTVIHLGVIPTQAPTVRPTLGPISFQTPTPLPTGAAHISSVEAAQVEGPVTIASPSTSGASVQTSGSAQSRPRTSPTSRPAPTATHVTLGKGQSMQVSLPAGTATCDTSQTFTFRYPGDASVVTIDAQLEGLNPSNAGDAGLNVWDKTSTTAPIATATTLTNQKDNILGSIELMYSRAIAGTVTIELYNWAQVPISGTVTVVSLASNQAPLQVDEQKAPGSC